MKNENNIYGYVRVSSIERLGRDYEKRRYALKVHSLLRNHIYSDGQ